MAEDFKEAWDKYYREVDLDDIPWRQDGHDDVISCLARRTPGTLLDVGCGTGEKAIRFASLGFDVTAVDISPAAINWARKFAAESGIKADFRVLDALQLTTLNLRFDYVIDFGCFHSMPKATRPPYVEELKDVVKPGGEFCLFAWDMRNTLEFQNRPQRVTGATERCFSRPQIEAIFAPEFEMLTDREVELEKPFETFYATFYLMRRSEKA
jgi:SAM-dependent methyltransferase